MGVKERKERQREALRTEILDAAGRVMRTLVDDHRGVGEHSAVWNGRNDHGERVASGVYFCQLEALSFRGSKRIVLLRTNPR